MEPILRWSRDQVERRTLLARIATSNVAMVVLAVLVIATGWLSGLYG